MNLTKHFIFISKNTIIRKLFLCRICNRKCIPSNFRDFCNGYKIATSYVCTSCSKIYVTNKTLYYSDTINVVFRHELKFVGDE
jgi:hypothetical protein